MRVGSLFRSIWDVVLSLPFPELKVFVKDFLLCPHRESIATFMSAIFTLDSFADGLAGSLGGMSAITTFYPLNMIRTRLQTSDISQKEKTIHQVITEILQEDGPAGLFKGWWGQIVALGTSNFVYFYTYQILKVWQQRRTGHKIGPVVNLAVGVVAGVVNVLVTSPLWCICTRLAVQAKQNQTRVAVVDRSGTPTTRNTAPYKGMVDGLIRCYQSEGIPGLWSGVGTNLILVCNPTLHFFVYERVRHIFERKSHRRGSPITSLEFFCIGAIAKAVATVFTYPIQVAQSQLRNDRKNDQGQQKYNGTVDCLNKIYNIGGVRGLFRGITAKLWQTVLTAAFQFMSKTRLFGRCWQGGGRY